MSLLLLGAAVFCRWQDPKPATQDPVAGASSVQQGLVTQGAAKKVASKQGPAKQDPAKQDAANPTKKPAGKVVGRPDRSPLEGVYRLRKRVTAGVPDAKPSKGYLAITGRHMFLSLASKGLDETAPLLHSGVREWIKVGADVRTTAKLDYYTDGAGVIHQTPEGKQEMRRIEIVLGGVRVIQGPHSWLEFERVE
ncbi:MAG: hypothetical protein ACI89X_000472 [Planctomycetota bacterium]|jgi:hypothetical protein